MNGATRERSGSRGEVNEHDECAERAWSGSETRCVREEGEPLEARAEDRAYHPQGKDFWRTKYDSICVCGLWGVVQEKRGHIKNLVEKHLPP